MVAYPTSPMDELSVKLCTAPDEWDEFVERHDGPAYALWGWGDAVEAYGHDRWYLAARADGSIVGVLPLFHIESKLFGSKLVSPPFAARGSLVLDDGATAVKDVLFERTRELAHDLDVDFVSLRGSRIDPPEAFERETRFVTFRTALSGGPNAVWQGLKDSRCRQIEQAADGSLTYEVADSIADLRDYYRLHLQSMRGHGTPPHSFEFFRVLWDRLHDEGHLRVGLVRRDGEPINGMLDLALGSTVYQWGVVNDYEHRGLNGGSLALWKSLEWAAERGYDVYEFGRTREGSGVYTFKKSFGGTKTWYDDLHYYPDRAVELPDPDDDRYDRLKDVWRRLPMPVTRAIGPKIRKNISL